jgi:exopolysaccharide biosynthesis polyprenyl glycosylphosphotransferase
VSVDGQAAVDVPQVALTLTEPEGSADTSLGRSETSRASGRRGWLMRRLLLGADVAALASAFALTELVVGSASDTIGPGLVVLLFASTLPVWLIGAKVFGLYDRDEERTDHSTSDDIVRVFLLVTVGVFLLTQTLLLTGHADLDLTTLTVFWGLAISCMTTARIGMRTVARRQSAYLQNTIIVGAGDVGQLVARKLLQHREYGLNLLGFVDARPKERRPDLGQLDVLGPISELLEIVRRFAVDRVIFAFSSERHTDFLAPIRSLRSSGVQVDIVPRLFEVIGPRVEVHPVEGFPLVGLPPARIPRSSRAGKRSLDVIGALIGLALTAPLFGLIAILIKRESPGPVLFRQKRLGENTHEFTLLKFRTMRVGTDDSSHRAYIAATMDSAAAVGANGLYKLDRDDAVTRVGRWLRRTSLDELPQLLNVLKGEMSLVGPRPCLPYEVEHFAPHHFDRFLVPAGLTGLWQVSARAHSSFGEALDLDVLYAHDWSLGLDLSLLARTPLQLLRAGGTA